MDLKLGSLSFPNSSDNECKTDNDSEADNKSESCDDDDEMKLCGFWSSKHWSYRYVILFLICIVSVTLSFNAEVTVGLSAAIVDVMNVDNLVYEYLEGFGTVPDIFICAIGGYVIDRCLSLGFGLISLTVIGLIGEGMMCLGVFLGHYWLMVVGITVVFAAQKLLEIIVYCYQVKWFRDKELTFALGLSTSARYIGLTLSMSLTNPFYEFLSFIPNPHMHLGMTFLVGPVAGLISIICGLAIVCLDFKKTTPQKVKKSEEDEHFDCKKKLSILCQLSVWLLAIAISTYCTVIDSYVTIGEIFFIEKFKLDANMAGFANSMLFGINIILLPVVGLMIDIIGYHVGWSLVGVVLGFSTHYMLLTFSNSFIPFIAQFVYAVSDSLFTTSTGPLPAYVVPESMEGTTYGIIRALNNLNFVIAVFATGYIADTGRYDILELFYLSMLVITFVSMSALLISDTFSDVGTVNISGKARRDKEQKTVDFNDDNE